MNTQPLPSPTSGPTVHRVTVELSAGEHICLCALAERWGASVESALGSLVRVDLRKRYERDGGREPAPAS